jgi:hypothetical protein
MKLSNFKEFTGEHCETTATCSLLKHEGVDFSESMLFGVGEALNFIYWDMRRMDFPFVGGRTHGFELTQTLVSNLGLRLDVNETTSRQKAWKNVLDYLEKGQPVGLQLDCYHLEYFSEKFHFPAHFVAIYGFDSVDAFLVDTAQLGGRVKTSMRTLADARAERGPMSSRNLSYTIHGTLKNKVEDLVIASAVRNARVFLNPPIQNIGYKGILKFSEKITTWIERTPNPGYHLAQTASLMERGGTGGAIFRNIYVNFLSECAELTGKTVFTDARDLFMESAIGWRQVAELLADAGQSGKSSILNEASKVLKQIAEQEYSAMERIASLEDNDHKGQDDDDYSQNEKCK